MKVLSSVKIDQDRLELLLAAQPKAAIVQVKDFSEPDPEAEVLLTYGWDVKEDTLTLYPNLKWLQTLSAGVDMLPLKRLEESEILLTNVKGAHKIPMAEHVIWCMLTLLRQSADFVHQRDQKLFSAKPRLNEMYGKTVCIVGAGMIGKEIAKRCEVFGMTVYGISRHGAQDPAFKQVFTADALPKVLSISDIVVIVLPLTPETKNFVNTAFIDHMKKDALFINAARGPVADEEVLVEALKNKRIAAAALDVFVREPLPEDSPFWDMENVFITPHIGGRTNQTTQRMWDVFTSNLTGYPDMDKMITKVVYSDGY